MSRKRVLLVARYYIIEPLGLLHLAGLVTAIGCEIDVELVPNNDFSGLYRRIEEWKPDFVGFQIWTGWHLQTFTACDHVRKMGPKVIIGGPHVTYFTGECAKHADYVVRGDGFRTLRRILEEEVSPGVHFDAEQLAEKFPFPNRAVVYNKYPVLRNSPIRSMITSIGCPFTCSYCYAPKWNEMYDGFKHTQRAVDDVIREGVEIRDRWGAQLIYLQDDIFGFDHKEWLPEFARRWKKEVGIPFHCQIRLELTRHAVGDERLDLFVAAGCTGITLAIESGDAFLREHVLHRAMPEELILEGCAKIRSRGMTLRTEQILAVPFSTLETDLATLDLNNRIGPEMAWTSILAPYGGTEMGDVAKSLGFYFGDNDDLHELFFDRSVMRHSKTAKGVIEPVIDALLKERRALGGSTRESPLRSLVGREIAPRTVEVSVRDTRDAFSREHLPGPQPLCTIEFMEDVENEHYADQIVVLQRLFMWFSFLPNAREVARRYLTLPRDQWTWARLGEIVEQHLISVGEKERMYRWIHVLAHELGCSSREDLPDIVRENPFFFVFFPSSAEFARHVIESKVIRDAGSGELQFDALGGVARRWLFGRSLYGTEPSERPIAEI